MTKQTTLATMMTLLLLVTSSPYLVATIISFHGHSHHIATELVSGARRLVLHHESHADSHSHSERNSSHGPTESHQPGDFDHIISLPFSQHVAPSIAQLIVKLIPAVAIFAIVLVFSWTLPTPLSAKSFVKNYTIPVSFLGLQTTVLII